MCRSSPGDGRTGEPGRVASRRSSLLDQAQVGGMCLPRHASDMSPASQALPLSVPTGVPANMPVPSGGPDGWQERMGPGTNLPQDMTSMAPYAVPGMEGESWRYL